MRIRNLMFNEFHLLYKYGIVFMYILFTVVYLCLLAAIPISARPITANILIYTDPAAMGLFFMGAMVLLEKSQRVESSLAVSPITLFEYIFAKVVPLAVIGIFVGFILSCYANVSNMPLVLLGVALSSALFSMCGLQVGANIKSLNSFMIQTIPFEIVICLPAILYLTEVIQSDFWILHPGVAAVRFISGNTDLWYLSFLSLFIWMFPAYFACKKSVAKSFACMGGAKL